MHECDGIMLALFPHHYLIVLECLLVVVRERQSLRENSSVNEEEIKEENLFFCVT